ncbi:DUF1837 domain-containing protein [Paraflavitalea sp. CAU 1676]|uniref:HamA C-terminal domain-containing protein n=1 Tax=Paraflavitalea sp. CAU 1676 TaxID=3032598 RepID=UPI0023DCA3E3|nr:DUF1837 domain-containing protein [Paraflavitalea sp. CAU 1676]MDF2192566.1 DUF1837 domain-containing protein [Paraflavitalea sp. CAU 1676]
MRPFNVDRVIEERINQIGLRAYHVGFDQQVFRFQPLADVIRKVIPEFAFGHHEGYSVPLEELVDRIKEAAQTVYDTDKYQKRGEFGELILHLLLRGFHGTVPLVSTMYFKDSINVPAHGFDGVQVSVTGEDKKLWLGESKLYKSGKEGVKELLADMKNHINNDYLRKQFMLISRKIPASNTEILYWRDLLDQHTKLEDIFKSLVIPMVCTYNSELFVNHTDNTSEYFEDFESECQHLFTQFQNGCTIANVEFILLLLPVPCKDSLNTELNKRLKHMQSI